MNVMEKCEKCKLLRGAIRIAIIKLESGNYEDLISFLAKALRKSYIKN